MRISIGNVEMTHELKIRPEYFGAVVLGYKTFELRKNDRDYHINDKLILKEWDTDYTGRKIERYVSYVFRGTGEYGLQEGYCILGLKKSLPTTTID